jgi:hypothetical protein
VKLRRLLPAALLVLTVGCQTNALRPEKYEPEPQIDRGRAEAMAKAGVLTPNDLKGWQTSKPEPDSPDANKAAQEIFRCMGRTELPIYAAEREAYFRKGTVDLSSYATVSQTQRQAENEVADNRNPALGPCLDKAFRESIPLPKGVTMSPIKMRPLRVAVRGTETYGMTLTITIKGPAKTATLTIVRVGGRVGNAILEVEAMTQGGAPPDTGALTRLLSTAVARVRAVDAK